MPETPNAEPQRKSFLGLERKEFQAPWDLRVLKKEYEDRLNALQNILVQSSQDLAQNKTDRLLQHEQLLQRQLGKGIEWADFRVHILSEPDPRGGPPKMSLQCSVDEQKAMNPLPKTRLNAVNTIGRFKPLHAAVGHEFGMKLWEERVHKEFPGSGGGRLWTHPMSLNEAMGKATVLSSQVDTLLRSVQGGGLPGTGLQNLLQR